MMNSLATTLLKTTRRSDMHFYTKTKNGVEPRHFVTMKSDASRTRPSRMSDYHSALKNGEKWYPSVTTILNVLDKPALSGWKIDQHIQTAFQIQPQGMSPEEYLEVIKYKTQQRLDEAPKAGTDCHLILESYFRDGVKPSGEIERKICENVRAEILKNCGVMQWECEKYFVNEEFGYAGCADLVSSDWVIDYKTKQEAAKFKPGKMAYPEHSRQLAAYSFELTKKFNAANIFICLETGEVDFHAHSEDSLVSGWEDFTACIGIFNRQNGVKQ